MIRLEFPPIDLTGLRAHCASHLIEIDAAARSMAARIVADLPPPSEMRAAADGYELSGASPWLVSFNRDTAARIKIDARLEAAVSLRCHPNNAGIVYFIDLYVDLVREACGLPMRFDRSGVRSASAAEADRVAA